MLEFLHPNIYYRTDYFSKEQLKLLVDSGIAVGDEDYTYEKLYDLEHEILEYINENCADEKFYSNEEMFDEILDIIMNLENESDEVNPLIVEINENDHVELNNGKTGVVIDITNNVYTIEVDENLKTGNLDDDIMIVASNSILGLAK